MSNQHSDIDEKNPYVKPVVEQGNIYVIQGQPEHGEAIADIDKAAYEYEQSPDDPFGPEAMKQAYLQSLIYFPEGQFVAIDRETNQVVGRTASMRCHFDPTQPVLHSWDEMTDGGRLTTHEAMGDWLYGVESAVRPSYQGRGVGRMLTQARMSILRRLNLKGFLAGSIIMNYPDVADRFTPEAYMREVAAGRLWDNNLSKQLKMGFKFQNAIPDYFDDPRTGGYAAAIVLENPDYNPRLGVLPTHILHPKHYRRVTLVSSGGNRTIYPRV